MSTNQSPHLHIRLRPGKDDDIINWMNAQKNVSDSIRFVLRMFIKTYGNKDVQDIMFDVLNDMLPNTTVKNVTEPMNPVMQQPVQNVQPVIQPTPQPVVNTTPQVMRPTPVQNNGQTFIDDPMSLLN